MAELPVPEVVSISNVKPPIAACRFVPDSLRQLNHFLKLGEDHLKIDLVISYWCYYYAAQKGLTLDKISTEAKAFIGNIINWLETQKLNHKDNEAIVHTMVGQAYIEKYVLDLMVKSDRLDRSKTYNKNAVKLLYTIGFLCETLQSFGELSQDFYKRMNYSKWRASYIHKCLKNGEIPNSYESVSTEPGNTDKPLDTSISCIPELNESSEIIRGRENRIASSASYTIVPVHAVSENVAKEIPESSEGYEYETRVPNMDEIKLILEAQKYSKIAAACLDSNDVGTAKDLLQKALEALGKIEKQ